MKVLVVGSGGREHAIAWMFSRSSLEPRVYVASDYVNPGLERAAEDTGGRLYVVKTTSPDDVVRVAEEVSPDLVFIGPEEPLFHGVSDALVEKGFAVVGALQRLAEIERSKVFARSLQWKYRIPGRLRFVAARSIEEAVKAAEAMGDAAVKPARQAGGHGVKLFAAPAPHIEEATREARRVYAERLARRVSEKYSDVEHLVIVEERVEGVEYTLTALSDGKSVAPLPVVQDHPHLFIHDIGPETGGMGAISGPSWVPPFLDMEEYRETVEILEKTVEALRAETGLEYVGVISAQSMLTALHGPTLIEYYARMGDPETANIAVMLDTDFLELAMLAAERRLAKAKVRIREGLYVVTKVVAPKGYPENRQAARNHPIDYSDALEEAERRGCQVFIAGVYRDSSGKLLTTGSRAVEVTCISTKGFEEASRAAEAVVARVRLLDGWKLIHRRDIGTREHIEARVREAEKARRVYRHRRRLGLGRVVYDWIPGRGVTVYDYS